MEILGLLKYHKKETYYMSLDLSWETYHEKLSPIQSLKFY